MVWAPAKTLNPMWPSAPPRGSTQANKTNKLTGELLLGFFSGCCLLLLLFLFSSSSSASFLSVFPLFLFCLSVFLIGPSIAVVAVVVVSFPHHFFPPVTLLCDSAFFDLISLIFLLFLNSVLLFSFLCFFFPCSFFFFSFSLLAQVIVDSSAFSSSLPPSLSSSLLLPSQPFVLPPLYCCFHSMT